MSAAYTTHHGRGTDGLQSTDPRDVAPGADEYALAIDVHGLCKTYEGNRRTGAVAALCGVDLQVRRGQHVAIMGASGSGKTTLLGCLSGRITPSCGRIEVNRQRVSTIHQDMRLVVRRTALQNVLDGALGRLSLWRTLLGYPRAENHHAWQLLERVGLKDRAHLPVGNLSGGQQQRVAIARSLMQNPEILLADEPVASLDESAARDIMALLGDLGRQHNLTRISVLHDWTLADAYSDRIIGLDTGRMVFDSTRNGSRPFQVTGTAADTVNVGPPHRNDRPEARAPWTRPWAFAAAMVAITAVYVLALKSLNIGSRQFEGIGTGLATFLAGLVPDSVEQVTEIPWLKLGRAVLETLGMSLIGTTLGILISWPMAALAAKNVGPKRMRHVVRFFLNGVRTVPSLIWALFFVAAVGLGPLAGVLALTAYSIGYLTKFFYEHYEAVEPGPPDALAEIGASGMQKFLFGVWPASKPAVLSSCIFMFEYNVRAASVLGIVGAGGIGYWFSQFFAWRNFPAALACLIMLLVVVVILDAISTHLRGRLVSTAK